MVEGHKGLAGAVASLGFHGLGQVLETGTSARRSLLCLLGPAALQPRLAGPKLQERWCLSSAPHETLGSTEPGGSSLDPGDPPPGADLPRLVLGPR